MYLQQRATGALVLLRCPPFSVSLLGLPRTINQPRQQLARIKCDENKTQENSGTQTLGRTLRVLRSLGAVTLSSVGSSETLTSDRTVCMRVRCCHSRRAVAFPSAISQTSRRVAPILVVTSRKATLYSERGSVMGRKKEKATTTTKRRRINPLQVSCPVCTFPS